VCPLCGEEPVNTILKCSETKLWFEVYIKNEWRHFGYEILMMKIANISNKELPVLKKMGEFLF
jgi:hypothetical protein